MNNTNYRNISCVIQQHRWGIVNNTDLYKQDDKGNTIFHNAIENKNTELCNKLLEIWDKDKLYIQTNGGYNIFHYTIIYENTEIIHILKLIDHTKF